MVALTFDEVSRDAWVADAEGGPSVTLQAAMAALGEPVGELTAAGRSGDAGLYHEAGHAVALYGAGRLACAGGAGEHVEIADMQRALAVSTLAAWCMGQQVRP